MNRSRPIANTAWVLLATSTLHLTGCQLLSERPQLVENRSETPVTTLAPKPNPTGTLAVDVINVLWSDAAVEVAGVPTQSGLAAKVYLIANDVQDPVRAEGTFSFYAWKDQLGGPTKVEPDRIWTFTSAQAKSCERQDAIGSYYAFWLPVAPAKQAGGEITLQAAFTAPETKPLLAKPNVVTLPGSQNRWAWKKKADILSVTKQHSATPATINDTKTNNESDQERQRVALSQNPNR